VLATYNIKGGVGKTSAAVNLAYLSARDGHRTLLWDLDPQGASTYLFRVKPKVRGGARKLVKLKSEVDGLIKGTDFEGLDLLPADFSYRHMDLALEGFKHPTRRLARVLEPLAGDYEYVFLDCPPSISLVSESVFEAADALLVPIIPATLSARTFDQLDRIVEGGPQVLAFFSMVEVRKSLHRQVMARVRAEHSFHMLGAAVPSADEIERMGEERGVVAAFAPGTRGAMAYEALWWDVRRRLRPKDR
jgi:cellulose biosynthesis protein BcsQ